MRFIVLFCFLSLSLGGSAWSKEEQKTNWQTINMAGLVQDQSVYGKPLSKNLWRHYKMDEAINLVESFPNKILNVSILSMADKMLTHQAKPFREDVGSPKFLAARLHKLIDLGLTDRAAKLYRDVVKDIPQDFDLALVGIKLILLDQSLAPACLDLQASSALFNQDERWHELSYFCQQRYGENNVELSKPETEHYPHLNDILTKKEISPNNLSSLELMIAFADKKIDAKIYNKLAQNPHKPSNLFIKLAMARGYSQSQVRNCYAIEAFNRGFIGVPALTDIYKETQFEQGVLDVENALISVHPCQIPALFYQKLSGKIHPDAASISRILLLTKDMPVASMVPLAPFWGENIDVLKNVSSSDLWRIAAIHERAGYPLWDDEELNQSIWPMNRLRQSDKIDSKEYQKWLSTYGNVIKTDFDPAVILYFSRSLSGYFDKLSDRQDKFDYENFFSLTYAQKYTSLGLGFFDVLHKHFDNDDIPKGIKLLSVTAGQYPPSDLSFDTIGGILASLQRVKLENKKESLVFRHLHY